MHTLLIIDMQNAWIDEHPRFNLRTVIEKINQLSDHFRRASLPVIFIQHHDNLVHINSDGWGIHQDLHQQSNDYFINKTACDAFAATTLEDRLHQLGSSSLIICGLATEFCVDTTLRASLSKGFDVIAVADAHTTADRPHAKAEAIIQHHNWIWTHIAAPQKRTIQVLDTNDCLKRI